MKAIAAIEAWRRSGWKPAYVMLDLVDGKPLAPWRTDTGAVHAEIGAEESLSECDFRALVGTRVHLSDRAGNETRFRRASRLIADAKPSMLAVYIRTPETFVMHRLFADGTSDRSAI